MEKNGVKLGLNTCENEILKVFLPYSEQTPVCFDFAARNPIEYEITQPRNRRRSKIPILEF